MMIMNAILYLIFSLNVAVPMVMLLIRLYYQYIHLHRAVKTIITVTLLIPTIYTQGYELVTVSLPLSPYF